MVKEIQIGKYTFRKSPDYDEAFIDNKIMITVLERGLGLSYGDKITFFPESSPTFVQILTMIPEEKDHQMISDRILRLVRNGYLKSHKNQLSDDEVYMPNFEDKDILKNYLGIFERYNNILIGRSSEQSAFKRSFDRKEGVSSLEFDRIFLTPDEGIFNK